MDEADQPAFTDLNGQLIDVAALQYLADASFNRGSCHVDQRHPYSSESVLEDTFNNPSLLTSKTE